MRDSLESDGNPLPDLISANVNKEYIKAHWLAKDIDFIDRGQHADFLFRRYPESKTAIQERAFHFTHEFLQLYGDCNEKTLHIIVSHGKPIEKFSQLHGGQKKNIRYCGQTCVAIVPQFISPGLKRVSVQLVLDCKLLLKTVN